MACFSPLSAWRAPGGGISFDRQDSYSDRPPIRVSCGYCDGCKVDRTRDWSARLVHEDQLHDRSCFLSLTYAPEHLPQDCGLDHRHWQLFAKRLRKARGRFRFFMCGEYGDTNLRPHYHAILYGHDFREDRQICEGATPDVPLYRSPSLEALWGLGRVAIGQVTPASAAYVARYVMKKRAGDSASYERVDGETGEVFQVRPEYVQMSRRPGIGAAWLDRFHKDVYPSDEVVQGGRKFRPPKYYDKRQEERDPEQMKAVHERRLDELDRKDNTPERLAVREACLNERLKRFERRL